MMVDLKNYYECYNCNSILTNTNKSVEHIINNSIGGRSKSINLICNECNLLFGNLIDKELADQIGIFADLLAVKRDRTKEGTKIQLANKNGELRLVGLGMMPLVRLTVNINGEKKNNFINEIKYQEVLQKRIKELSKKFKKIEYKEGFEKPPKESLFIQNSLSRSPQEIGFGGINYFRSVAKIALNFYLSKKPNRQFCKDLISFVVTGLGVCPVYFFYPTNIQPHNLYNDEVSHIIHIKGSSIYKFLYAYIELFNMQNFIVILNMDYTGEDVNITYAYDLLRNTELHKDVSIRINRAHLENMNLISLDTKSNMSYYYNRLIKIIESRQLTA